MGCGFKPTRDCYVPRRYGRFEYSELIFVHLRVEHGLICKEYAQTTTTPQLIPMSLKSVCSLYSIGEATSMQIVYHTIMRLNVAAFAKTTAIYNLFEAYIYIQTSMQFDLFKCRI